MRPSERAAAVSDHQLGLPPARASLPSAFRRTAVGKKKRDTFSYKKSLGIQRGIPRKHPDVSDFRSRRSATLVFCFLRDAPVCLIKIIVEPIIILIPILIHIPIPIPILPILILILILIK